MPANYTEVRKIARGAAVLAKSTARQKAAGRPKDAVKRSAILRVARKMFFERGLEAVTIEAVAGAAGVSRMTVYGHFGGKEKLFTEVIAREARSVGRVFAELADLAIEKGTSDPARLSADLIAFGVDLTLFLSSPEILVWNRLMSAAAPHHPKLAKAFLEAGPYAVMKMLSEKLRRCSAAGSLVALNPGKAARQLIGMFRAIETSAISWGLAPFPGRREIERHVSECVKVFLRAYASSGTR